jgi:uncharacterized protein (TIGR02270 family)
MTATPAPIIPYVLRQHAVEVASLHVARTTLTEAPHTKLYQLSSVDERLSAHLDGLAVADKEAWPFCESTLEELSAEGIFTTAVRAIESGQHGKLDPLFALVQDRPALRDGLASAFGWTEARLLQGLVTSLLKSSEGGKRLVGIAACAAHGVDPGLASRRLIHDPAPYARARAFRSAGELGRSELVSTCSAATTDDNDECRFWAAWAAVLLGERNRALRALTDLGLAPGGQRERAFLLSLQAMDIAAGNLVLQRLAKDPAELRWLVSGSGIVGDPAYVPWLITHMANPALARLAGEAFTNITGLDLFQGFEVPRPEGFESGPSDDPNDEDVAMDPDEGLPWPDTERIHAWWASNAARFAAGTRHFIGAPVTRQHCIHVLKNGYQRQRILAAHNLCLLEPGTPLFNTSAPAWRQQRLLAKMT